MKKEKLLLILHYSPPVHGASIVGDTILNSTILKSNFDTQYIKIKSSQSIKSIGKFNFKKILDTVILFFKITLKLILFRPQKIYFTASPHGFAFYRDVIITLPIKVYNTIKKCDVFYHYHAKGILEFTSKSKLNKKLTNFFVKGVLLIFISKRVSNEVNHLSTFKKVLYLKNGVKNNVTNQDFIKIIDNRSKKGKIKILYLSNMIKTKGYDTVLELAKEILKENKNFEFNFAGNWASLEDQNYFTNYIKNNNLKNHIKYHGLVQGKKKQQLFKDANLFIFPSRYPKEVFPLSLLEALSYGLPILAFDVGAVSEIVVEKAGIISNKERILNSFEQMQNQYLNKDVYLACRKLFLENYTTSVFEKKLVAILKLYDEHTSKSI